MKVSVIIPCRNEVKHIEECVDAIFANKIESETTISVKVVDGMSDDGTLELIENLKKKYPNLVVVPNYDKLTPYAFNLGIKDEKADFYQIVGARQVLSENYIQRAIDTLKASKDTWCVGGSVENVYLNEIGKIISLAMSTPFGMGLGNFRVLKESGYTDTVGTPMYPHTVFEKIGYFDENLIRNQDDDFNYRVTKAGGKIFFDTDISLKYYVRGNFKGLWRQFFQYGYWKVFVNRKHKAVTTLRQLVPPLFVVFLLLTPLSCLLPSIFQWLTVGVWGIYLAMLVYFSAKQASSFKQFFLIAYTFPILHLSYGLGYLRGIFDFLLFGKSPSEKQTRLSR